MDISVNSKEGKVSAIKPNTSYIPRLHGMLAWYDNGMVRSLTSAQAHFHAVECLAVLQYSKFAVLLFLSYALPAFI